MTRLTDKRLALPPGVWQEVTREQWIELQEIPVPSKQELYYRLFEIEEILCDSVGDSDPDAEDEYDLDRLAVMCNQRMSMRDEVSERFSLTKDIPLDRLRELVEADREGRCVVLPCKRDDVLWTFHTYPSERVYSFHVTDVSVLNGRTMLNTDIMGVVDARDVGKTVFLTRDAAEEAMKARKQE